MAERGAVQLGDDEKDTITGLIGTVVAITSWLNGCVRVTIQPRELKDYKPVDTSTIDIEQIEVLTRAAAPKLKKSGGPHPEPSRY